MEKQLDCFKVWNDPDGRRIVYSRGEGRAHAHEISDMCTELLELSKDWQDDKGFAYIAFIEDLIQVTPKGSDSYVELHQRLRDNNCKYIVYIEGNSYEVSVQASRHKAMSNTPETVNKYFITVEEGLEFLSQQGF